LKVKSRKSVFLTKVSDFRGCEHRTAVNSGESVEVVVKSVGAAVL